MTIIEETVASADWLAHRYDSGHDAIQFVHADRAARAAATFLTDEHLGPRPPRPIARRDAAALAAPGTLHFVFHSAYCCSTLVARALDVPGMATALKEPQILNDIVGWRHRGAPAPAANVALHTALSLLARPFEEGEAVVVKPSNVVNALAPAMLAARPEARALLLHAPLPAFLASIARKGLWGRLWVRDLLSKQLLDGMIDLGFEQRDYLLLTDLQVAAVGWLAQHALFVRLAAKSGGRAVMLDSETLVADPPAQIHAIARHFGLPAYPALAATVTREFGRDAKTGAAFGAGQRAADRRNGEAEHADELAKVTAWAHAVAKNAGVPLPNR